MGRGMGAAVELPRPRLLRVVPAGITAELNVRRQWVAYWLALRDRCWTKVSFAPDE
jgi:hypothetical protein